MVLFDMLIYDIWYGNTNEPATSAKEVESCNASESRPRIRYFQQGHVRSWPERERLDEMTRLLIVFMPVTMGHD